MKIPGKRVTILGLGVSGFESALFLKDKGFDLWVSDQGDSEILRERLEKLRKKGIHGECGGHSKERILESDWVLISPGIPPASDIYRAFRSRNIPIYSEIEVASWFSPSSKIIAVTGTSGKTTVTTLITRVLKRGGFKAVSCGNIGNPWIAEIAGITENDFVVLEVSSFQLEHCESFRPRVAVLINLSPNHEDWHKDMAEYTAAKLKIFKNQMSEDLAVFRARDRQQFFPDYPFKARTFNFGEGNQNPNEEAVRLVTGFFGCKPQDVDEVLGSFEGIEHRLEKFLVSEGVAYVNDSKCTTVASLKWGLEKFPDHKVILLAGGHPKTKDFHTIRELLERKVKKAILIGEARPILREAWEGACPLRDAESFKDAVQIAHQLAVYGDTVLLSPACASFDMFKNYMERGNLFKQFVHELAVAPAPK